MPSLHARRRHPTRHSHHRPARHLLLEWLEGRCLLATTAVTGPTPVLMYHNDGGSTGQDLNETVLAPGNVNAASFGLLYTGAVDGNVYAQPLYVPNVAIPGLGARDLV